MTSAAKRLDAVTAAPGEAARMPPLAMSMRMRSSRTKSGRRRAGVLRPAGKALNRAQGVLAVGGEVQGVGVGRHECRGEAPVAGVQGADLLDDEAEAVPRVGIGEPLVHDGVARPHLFRECLGDQRLLGREVAVQGGRAHSGAAGDLPHRDVQAFGGEQPAGRVKDELAVIPGVGTQGVRQTAGHRSHFSQTDGGVR